MYDDRYRTGFVHKFNKNVVHSLDCPEINIEVCARPKAHYFAHMLKSISPEMFPLAETSLVDHNLEKRLEIEKLLKQENDQLKLVNSEIGLNFLLYPKQSIDRKEVYAMNENILAIQLKERNLVS